MLTAKDFEALGCWEDITPDENIKIYGMEFGKNCIEITDELGKTPVKEEEILVVSAFDENNALLWGKELKSFADFKALCQKYPAESQELFAALAEYRMNIEGGENVL